MKRSLLLMLSIIGLVMAMAGTVLGEKNVYTVKLKYDSSTVTLEVVGQPDIQMKTGGKLEVYVSDAPNNITFKVKKQSGSGEDFDLSNRDSSQDGTPFWWATIPEENTGQYILVALGIEGISFGDKNLVFSIESDQSDPAAMGVQAGECQTYYSVRNDSVVICFTADGRLHNNVGIPRDLDENDVFYIYIYDTPMEFERIQVEIEGKLADDEPSVYGAGRLSDFSALLAEARAKGEKDKKTAILIGSYGPYAAPSVTIKILNTQTNVTLASYPIRINRIYRARLGFSVAYSNIVLNEYALGAKKGASGDHIVNRGHGESQARYFVTVTFNSFWPKDKELWRGRDYNKPVRKFVKRLHPFVGLGLQNIPNEYAAGLAFELSRGLDAVGGLYIVRSEKLGGGFEEGDLFETSQDDIPIKYDWKAGWYFGLSIDIHVASSVLGGMLR